MSDLGKALRLNRILKGRNHKALVIAFDHGGILGPIPGTLEPEAQLRRFAEAGVDGVLLNPGLLRFCREAWTAGPPPAVIVRLDWSNLWTIGPGDQARYRSALLTRPEDALRMGADAVMTYLFVGTGDAEFEAREIQRNAEVARECERLGLPLIVESLARGPGVKPGDPKWLMLHTRIAVELGADAIKTEYTGDPATMRGVVEACPVPILALGGTKLPAEQDTFAIVKDILASGAAGILFGRNVFQSEDMPRLLKGLLALLREQEAAAEHRRETVEIAE